jgi:hypothetical protein
VISSAAAVTASLGWVTVADGSNQRLTTEAKNAWLATSNSGLLSVLDWRSESNESQHVALQENGTQDTCVCRRMHALR